MLFDLRDYLAKETSASIEQLSRHFRADKSALLPMLDVWVNKGVIQSFSPQNNCAASCLGCDEVMKTYYQYCQK